VGTRIVPVILGEIKARRSPLDARAVDKNMDLAVHYVQSLLEKATDRLEIGQVAVDGLRGGTQGLDRVQGV
jgi:hypothetical protein